MSNVILRDLIGDIERWDAPPYTEVLQTDSTVQRMTRLNRPSHEIICLLAAEKKALIERVIQLEKIAPKKFRMADGSIQLWQCPPEMIPETPGL